MNHQDTPTSFRAWHKAMDLVNAVYQTTGSFPKELHPLTSRLRNSALSVSSHIAVSATEKTSKQVTHFLSNAVLSLKEIEEQLERALSLGYLVKQEHSHLRRMVSECLSLTDGLRSKAGHFSSN